MNLYDQLRALQTLDHAYTEWTQYREDLTDTIIQYAKGSKKVAIFGAGPCNDIDLNKLVGVFEEIILLDKDVQAMKKGIKQQNVKKESAIQLHRIDLVGIEDEDYRSYAACLIREIRKKGMKTDIHEFAEFALEQLACLFQKAMQTPLSFETLSYETAVVVGLHSQLLSMLEWIWSIMLQTIQQDEISVRNRIIEMNEVFVKRLNDVIIEGTTHNMIIGCEKARKRRVGTIQGAIQALDDVQKRQEEGTLHLCAKSELSWPFHKAKGIEYEMVIQSLKKS